MTGAWIRSQAHQTPDGTGALIKIAHGNMDGVTVFHCLEGETRYWSHDGIRTLKETAGTTQKVLTSSGKWVDAHIHAFGEQSLMKVTLRRNKREKVIFATPEHRWIVRTGTTHHEGTTTTENLKPEHRLASRVPKSRIGQTVPSQFGIAHGFVYGDGTRAAGSTSVNLWGEKDAQMLKYFNESIMSPRKTDNGVLGTHISCLPAFFKEHPSLDEATSYLYGWMAGYFAADGTVSKSGQVVLHSARQADLEFVQLVGMRLGIATYDIIAKERQGYGDEPSTLYSMQFVGSTLNSNFFLTKTHRERFDSAQAKDTFDRIGWTVVSVENTDRFEEVFCAVVPGTESFVLDGLILTGNCPFCGSSQVVNSGPSIECGFCQTNFSVLVQPQYDMMPQTVNGEPYVPGQPPGGAPPPSGPAPVDPAGDDEGSFGGDQLSEKVDTDSNDENPVEGDNSSPKPDGDDDKNPFAKDSSLHEAAVPDYQQKALDKINKAPKPTKDDDARYQRSLDDNHRAGGELRGNSTDRHRRNQKLLTEFGDGKTAKCSYCGTKVDHKSIQQDKIYPHDGYRYANLIPACRKCNQGRGNADVHTFMKTHRRTASTFVTAEESCGVAGFKVHDVLPGHDYRCSGCGETVRIPKSGPYKGAVPPHKKTKTATFVTAEGVALDEERYIAYLALKFTDDRPKTLAEVQDARRV